MMRKNYIMESFREGDRLESKTDAAAAEEQLRRFGLRSGMSALDVGCGTGAVTRVMSSIASPATVFGLDRSSTRLTQARGLADYAGLEIEFTEGDVYLLPFADGTFDFTWSRFLFEYLAEPEEALAELWRVTRVGGTVVVADLDGQIGQIYPLPDLLGDELDDSMRLLAESGFDPFVGRKLFYMFSARGFHDVQVHVQPYQVYAGGLPERDLANWDQKLATAAERLITMTGDRLRFEHLRDTYLSHLASPDTFYYCSMIMVSGEV